MDHPEILVTLGTQDRNKTNNTTQNTKNMRPRAQPINPGVNPGACEGKTVAASYAKCSINRLLKYKRAAHLTLIYVYEHRNTILYRSITPIIFFVNNFNTGLIGNNLI